jgi:hypothetical protein
MELGVGDLVRTESGTSGAIAYISRLTAFVAVREGETTNTVPFLLSQLSPLVTVPASRAVSDLHHRSTAQCS